MDIIYRFDLSQPSNPEPIGNAEAAMKALQAGNHRYREFVRQIHAEMNGGGAPDPVIVPSTPQELGISTTPGQAPQQTPFAIFLGCADARASVETIFDVSLNQLFTVRVAGNVLGSECLGSIEYAVRHLAKGVRLLVVLGHKGCGAVGAALEVYLNPDSYVDVVETHSLRAIVDRLLVAVRMADRGLHDICGPVTSSLPGYKAALGEMAVYLNAALTARDIQRELRLVADHPIRIVFGVYDLGTHLVQCSPDSEEAFSPTPSSTAEFNVLIRNLAESLRDRGVLMPLNDPNLA